jgi:hypothetical protein
MPVAFLAPQAAVWRGRASSLGRPGLVQALPSDLRSLGLSPGLVSVGPGAVAHPGLLPLLGRGAGVAGDT